MHRQLRALTILDGLIQNAGPRFQRTFADEPLLERLRMMPRDDLVDPDVRKKCNQLYRQWAADYKNTPGLERIAMLSKQLPQTKRQPQPSQSKVIRETEAEAARDTFADPPTSPPRGHARAGSSSATNPNWTPQRPAVSLEKTSSSSFFGHKDKKNKGTKFNLEKDKPKLMETIASAQMAATNLTNALRLINREHSRVSDNAECKNRFEQCKNLRRAVLRYIQVVESEQFVGSLLSANDELVKALMSYEVMDKSIDDDSDSDAEYQVSKAAFQRRTSGQADIERDLAGLSIDSVAASAPSKPPRPTSIAMLPPVPAANQYSQLDEEEEDEDDPFADRNAVKTPHVEKTGLTW